MLNTVWCVCMCVIMCILFLDIHIKSTFTLLLYSCTYNILLFYIGVPEQALGWCPLGFGLAVENELSELPYLHVCGQG